MAEYKFNKNILIGGLVALTFDPSEKYLFVVTHSGRGVFDIETGETVARDYEVIYPTNGFIQGIGPLLNTNINVAEYDFVNDLIVISKSGKYKLTAESSNIKVEELL